MTTRQRNAARSTTEGAKLTVRSALNPILWLCALISAPGIVTASLLVTVPTWLVILISAPVAAAIVGFFVLLLVDRDKLQSEEYQLRKQSLELMQQKGEMPTEIGIGVVIETPEANLLPGRAK